MAIIHVKDGTVQISNNARGDENVQAQAAIIVLLSRDTSHIANQAKFTIYVAQRSCEKKQKRPFPPELQETSDLLFLTEEVRHTRPPHITHLRQRPPYPKPGPVTSGPKDPGHFLSPVQNAPVVPI